MIINSTNNRNQRWYLPTTYSNYIIAGKMNGSSFMMVDRIKDLNYTDIEETDTNILNIENYCIGFCGISGGYGSSDKKSTIDTEVIRNLIIKNLNNVIDYDFICTVCKEYENLKINLNYDADYNTILINLCLYVLDKDKDEICRYTLFFNTSGKNNVAILNEVVCDKLLDGQYCMKYYRIYNISYVEQNTHFNYKGFVNREDPLLFSVYKTVETLLSDINNGRFGYNGTVNNFFRHGVNYINIKEQMIINDISEDFDSTYRKLKIEKLLN